jgi:hypothetical protein
MATEAAPAAWSMRAKTVISLALRALSNRSRVSLTEWLLAIVTNPSRDTVFASNSVTSKPAAGKGSRADSVLVEKQKDPACASHPKHLLETFLSQYVRSIQRRVRWDNAA